MTDEELLTAFENGRVAAFNAGVGPFTDIKLAGIRAVADAVTAEAEAESDLPDGARTAEDLQEEFLLACREIVDTWAAETRVKSEYDRAEGVMHSMLCLLDGVHMSFPMVELTCSPHPDDKAYHQAQGEDWIEPGTVISTGPSYLHDLFAAQKKAEKPYTAAPEPEVVADKAYAVVSEDERHSVYARTPHTHYGTAGDPDHCSLCGQGIEG